MDGSSKIFEKQFGGVGSKISPKIVCQLNPIEPIEHQVLKSLYRDTPML